MTMKHVLAGATATALALVLGAASASADTIPGSTFSSATGAAGYGMDPYGNYWEFTANRSSTYWSDTYQSYGYAGTPNATGFEITFTGNAASSIIATGNYAPYFWDATSNIVWDVSVSGAQVTWSAPAGASLASGDKYYTYVDFSDDTAGGSNSGFSAAFTGAAAAPEPATWAMMALGFAGLGFAGFRARRAAAVPAG
ncbi:PEP-CTERM sorting domain-containing protein [Roseiarcus fermentans]|nr:PEP-CTERM sorting domain-containing protein [Roseiarcus fermentans]